MTVNSTEHVAGNQLEKGRPSNYSDQTFPDDVQRNEISTWRLVLVLGSLWTGGLLVALGTSTA